MLKITSGHVIKKVKELNRIINKQFIGFARLPNKEELRLNITSGSVTIVVKELSKITNKQFIGTERLPNRDLQMLNLTSGDVITKVKVLNRTTNRRFIGTERLPNKAIAGAQLNLGVRYFNGQGVIEDFIEVIQVDVVSWNEWRRCFNK